MNSDHKNDSSDDSSSEEEEVTFDSLLTMKVEYLEFLSLEEEKIYNSEFWISKFAENKFPIMRKKTDVKGWVKEYKLVKNAVEKSEYVLNNLPYKDTLFVDGTKIVDSAILPDYVQREVFGKFKVTEFYASEKYSTDLQIIIKPKDKIISYDLLYHDQIEPYIIKLKSKQIKDLITILYYYKVEIYDCPMYRVPTSKDEKIEYVGARSFFGEPMFGYTPPERDQ